MRRLTLSILLAATLPMSTITAQESQAIINYHKNSTVGIIYRVTGRWRPNTANLIEDVLAKFPEIDRDRFLAMILQESSFDSELVQHGDYGLTQIHMTYWADRYGLNKNNILNEQVNLTVGAHIWLTYAGQDYSKYNGTKKNLRFYNKKLREIKGT